MDKKDEALFTPWKIGNVEIKNRIVGTKAPEICPVCSNPQAYFEVHKENF